MRVEARLTQIGDDAHVGDKPPINLVARMTLPRRQYKQVNDYSAYVPSLIAFRTSSYGADRQTDGRTDGLQCVITLSYVTAYIESVTVFFANLEQ